MVYIQLQYLTNLFQDAPGGGNFIYQFVLQIVALNNVRCHLSLLKQTLEVSKKLSQEGQKLIN